MKKSLLCLLLLIPVAVIFLLYGVGNTVSLVVEFKPDYIELDYTDGEELMINDIGDEIELYGRAYPAAAHSDIVWTCSPNENGEIIAEVIDGNKLKVTGEGRVTLTASSAVDANIKKSVTAYIVFAGSSAKYLHVSLPGAGDRYYFGMYKYENGEKVKDAGIKVNVKVIPSAFSADVQFDPMGSDCQYNDGVIAVGSAGDKTVRFVSGEISTDIEFTVVDAVNVYSYDDLLACTNKSAKGEVAVLQINLESQDNMGRENTALFGRVSGNKTEVEYDTFESTYDTTYLKNIKADKSKFMVKTGIVFKKDFYGNGYTLNAHELCFPSDKRIVNEEDGIYNPYPSASDLFQGPVPFISAAGMTVYGQDNSAFSVMGNVVINGVTLKNCNNVGDLTHLDYVGTTLEVRGDNVTLENCELLNGRTVLRSFSCEDLLVENCKLSYAREFIFKIGSNSFMRGKMGTYNDRAPVPRGVDGQVLSDSSATVRDTWFSTSGMFCIGIDTHFAGSAIAGDWADRFPFAKDLAATSYASKLKLEGDIVFDDWKNIDSLDASTLIDSGGKTVDGNTSFPLVQMIEKIADDMNIYRIKNGKKQIHGGIAFFGGGRNLSEIDMSDMQGREKLIKFSLELNDERLASLNGKLLAMAAGEGPFTFYIESPESN